MKSLFAECDTPEKLATALQARMASGKLTIAEQNAASLLCRIKGWGGSTASQTVQDVTIVPSGTSIAELRRDWEQSFGVHDTFATWMRDADDSLFVKRVTEITGVSPLASAAERNAFYLGILNEAIAYVKGVRLTLAARRVTLEEVRSVHEKSSAEFQLWSRPTRLEILRYVIDSQMNYGFDFR